MRLGQNLRGDEEKEELQKQKQRSRKTLEQRDRE